jgi:hypothetical protein
MQQPVLLSPKFGVKSKHIFTQSPHNTTAVCGIDCLACQDEFFMNSPLDFKENDEHVLAFFCLSDLYTAHAFIPECLSNHFQCLCRAFSEISTKFDAANSKPH